MPPQRSSLRVTRDATSQAYVLKIATEENITLNFQAGIFLKSNHPTIHRTVPTTKNYLIPNVNSAEVEKHHLKLSIRHKLISSLQVSMYPQKMSWVKFLPKPCKHTESHPKCYVCVNSLGEATPWVWKHLVWKVNVKHAFALIGETSRAPSVFSPEGKSLPWPPLPPPEKLFCGLPQLPELCREDKQLCFFQSSEF